MCGIFGLINKGGVDVNHLIKCTDLINYRGPDDSGYMLYNGLDSPNIYAGKDTNSESIGMHKLESIPADKFKLGFGHRRLSILDVSPHGHQPMIFDSLCIIFNGEVYNYLEIRLELEKTGRTFRTGSDTEVILQAWDQWGEACLDRFNGMFAFLILDWKKNILWAVRDRFGVKPLYFSVKSGYVAFSSEVKQLRLLNEYKFLLNDHIAFDYLKYGYLDHELDTFEKNINQLMPGQIMTYDLANDDIKLASWYTFQPKKWIGTFEQACEEFRRLLKDAVKLRLRSDVPVGSALSGGLDSSTIVCLMRELLDEAGDESKVLETVTSCSLDKKYDETEFAEIINRKTNSRSHKVYPDFEKLQADLEKLVWHLDYPFGSTSQFSQWCVFEGANKAGLTVMIDGQGADEQLAGYGGNDLPLYSGLLRKGKFGVLKNEIKSYKSQHGQLPIGFLLGAIHSLLPKNLKGIYPERMRTDLDPTQFWLKDFSSTTNNKMNRSLKANLLDQIQISPLPSLLRYEDRNSMAFSVESRTPFMDYRILEFALGLPEEFIYKNGERKFILRKAFKDIVPSEILNRRDKMGFVSSEERWMKEEGKDWFFDQIVSDKLDTTKFNINEVASYTNRVMSGDIEFSFEPWRILNFNFWVNKMSI
ncbi:asparagine synthase (glutamine-hydrolyzing) [Algoriphagus sp.]|uniref:asparagine synthase (glutamine-hydrolyzing) n=1 Tax=Algoriphagus sp. TaxID=1872435 RepID=UPI00391ADB0C